MNTTMRKTALLGTVLAVALAVVTARSDARVVPVDTEKAKCQVSVTTEFVQQLPQDPKVSELLKNAPGVNFAPERATVTVQRDSRQRVNDFYVDGVHFDGQTMQRVDFDSVNFNAAGCMFKGLTPMMDLGGGYKGKIQLEYRTRPNLRLHWNVRDLRGPGGPIKGDKLFFFLPASTSTFADQPPSDTPPTGAPGDDTPGFTGWQPRLGLNVRVGGLFTGSFQKKEHSAEEHARHTINSVALCDVLSGGNTTVEVFNLRADGFSYRGVGGSNPNLSFGDGSCIRDRCEIQGTFYGRPLRKTLDGFRASGDDLLADTTVFFNRSQFGLVYRGRYDFTPGSGSTLPVPSVPIVPVPPPQPAEGFPIYRNGPLLRNGATARGNVSKIPHTNCDGHTVVNDGVTYRLCTAGEGETSLTAFNVTPKNFEFRKEPVPRGWEWGSFACEPSPDGTVGCTGKGKYLGYDISSTITNLQVTPGTLNFGANINVRLLSTQGDVGFRVAGQVESLGH